MPARVSVTVSPSSSRMRRSTPWVDGCCGPMLTTIRSSWSEVASSMRSSQSPPEVLRTKAPSAADSSAPDVAYGSLVRWVVLMRGPRKGSERSADLCGVPLVVAPALVGRRDRRALVLDGDAAERVVLALRVAGPVVRHEDPREGRMAVELEPEHVPRLPLVPVVRGVDRNDRRDVRVGVGAGDLDADPVVVVGDRQEVVDGVQLAAGLVRVVDAGDAHAQLEPEVGVVAQDPRHGEQVLAADEHRHLATVDGDPLDGLVVGG